MAEISGINMEASTERVKRANITYFLSRNGSVENPRLMTVDYPSDIITLHLRDVKRWLYELEGNGLPNSLAWSHKRRYKNGYKWIELKDHDIITPISNNDYILRATILQLQQIPGNNIANENIDTACTNETPLLDDGSFIKLQHKVENADRSLTRVKIDASVKNEQENRKYQKRRGATNVCCNILGCAKKDANDSVLLSSSKRPAHDVPHQQRSKYMLTGAPSCAQCGRRFEPEKLQLHMKSCKGLKIREKGGNGVECRGYRKNGAENEKELFNTRIPGY